MFNELGPISVHSTALNLGPSITQHANTVIRAMISKSFNSLISADVHFSVEGEIYQCTVQLQVGGGPISSIIAEARGNNCYQAFNTAAQKADTQLRKAKQELRIRKGIQTYKRKYLQESERPVAEV